MSLERSRDKVSKAVFDMEPTAVIELFRIYPNESIKPNSYINVHNGSVFGGAIVWQGELYNPVPMETEGFSISSSGKPNRPIMRISNRDYLITNLLANNEDFKNAKIERKRTFLKYLDDENFDGGNPWGEPDPKAEITVDFYLVAQKRQENKVYVELELGSPLDIESRDLTNRKVLAKYCFWNYRGPGCQYEGNIVQRSDGKPFTYKETVSFGDNRKITTSYLNARTEAIAEGRSFLGMEKYDIPFVFQNANDLYDSQKFYRPGHIVYTINERIRIQDQDNPQIYKPSIQYYLARAFVNRGREPREWPDLWEKDGCGKKLHQCKLRFAKFEKQKVYLDNETYEQQLWNIEGFVSAQHQSYLRFTDNSSSIAKELRTLFKYNRKRWGYPHPQGSYKDYNQDSLYDNHFEIASTRADCKTNSDTFWTTTNNTDINKEFTILLDIPYLGPPLRYEFFPTAIEEQDKEEDVDQIIFKTGKYAVGYDRNHRQFVLGLQKEPYIEFATFAPLNNNTKCATRAHRVRLVGGLDESDYFRVTDKNGIRKEETAGTYDVKNSKNFVFSLRKDKFEGRARFRANWSCLTYPDNEETESVFVECQTTFYVKNMHTPDADRMVFFGGYSRMPRNDFADVTNIEDLNFKAQSYVNQWSQQSLKVATMAFFKKSLSNSALRQAKSTQPTSEDGGDFQVELVKPWAKILEGEGDRLTEDLITSVCLVFWQEPFLQNGLWYVKDHKNGQNLIYKGGSYGFAGGGGGAYTDEAFNFLDIEALQTRTPNVGTQVTIEGEFGTLPFGGFPGTDGYTFRSN